MTKAAPASTEPARPEFPLVYAMHLNCPGGHGDWRHDDLLLFNTLEEPKTGDVVCIHFRNGREPVLLELTMGIMEDPNLSGIRGLSSQLPSILMDIAVEIKGFGAAEARGFTGFEEGRP